jgi:hypothetical protein
MKTLIETRAGDCMWPVDEIDGIHHFCARPKQDKSSYCPAHTERSIWRREPQC